MAMRRNILKHGPNAANSTDIENIFGSKTGDRDRWQNCWSETTSSANVSSESSSRRLSILPTSTSRRLDDASAPLAHVTRKGLEATRHRDILQLAVEWWPANWSDTRSDGRAVALLLMSVDRALRDTRRLAMCLPVSPLGRKQLPQDRSQPQPFTHDRNAWETYAFHSAVFLWTNVRCICICASERRPQNRLVRV